METKKSVLKVTFDYLDGLRPGQQFTGWDLSREIQRRTGEYHYPDTCLRYVRYYRRQPDANRIVCISRPKSLYQVEAAA